MKSILSIALLSISMLAMASGITFAKSVDMTPDMQFVTEIDNGAVNK